MSTVPPFLEKRLSCPHHKDKPVTCEINTIKTQCGKTFKIYDHIPSLTINNPEEEDWNPWSMKEVSQSGESYIKRANGELPEKEASKSFAYLLRDEDLFRPGDSILDYGCAAGHFYKSFDRILQNPHYTGFDSHQNFLYYASQIFNISNYCNFIHCDALNIPILDNSYDISTINLFHFFPDPYVALKEALRVTKKYVVWRTPIAQKQNYIIKLLHNHNTPINLCDETEHDLCILLTKKYIRRLVQTLGHSIKFIKRDINFEPFDNTTISDFEHIPATKVVDNKQINGPIIMDWHYIVIEK